MSDQQMSGTGGTAGGGASSGADASASANTGAEASPDAGGTPAVPTLDPKTAGRMPPPTLAEVRGWLDFSLEDIDGAGVGRISGCFVDAEDGAPVWLLDKLGLSLIHI